MADKTKPLVCKQCGYANESERVYCHNCGTKLDRSLLPALSEPEETLEKKQKRIRKIVTPKRGFFGGSGKSFAYTMLCSVLAAALLLMALPPDDIPKPAPADELPDVDASMSLENALQAPAPEKIQFKQDDINAFLQSKLKNGAGGLLGDSVKFARVFVHLDEDRIRISTEQKVFGIPIYCTIGYKLAIAGNKLQATVTGGDFGRLQIHPNLMKNFGSVFQKIWDTEELKRDKRLLDQCQSIEVHKGEVDVISQPATAENGSSSKP